MLLVVEKFMSENFIKTFFLFTNKLRFKEKLLERMVLRDIDQYYDLKTVFLLSLQSINSRNLYK
jgi:hypothetical protein